MELYKQNEVFLTVLDTIYTERDFTSLQLILKSCLILKIKLLWMYLETMVSDLV